MLQVVLMLILPDHHDLLWSKDKEPWTNPSTNSQSPNFSRSSLAVHPNRQEVEHFQCAFHELEVYQEETKTQNQQLIEAQRLLAESRDRYVDLYEFAPIAYITFDQNGVILDINLTGAVLLGKERTHILGYSFNAFVADVDRGKLAGPYPPLPHERRRGDERIDSANGRRTDPSTSLDAVALDP